MILTSLMRLLMGRQPGPFRFQAAPGFLPDFAVPSLGLYVHVPFCRTLCPFCPYYKERYSADAAAAYLKALGAEIRLVGERVSEGGRRDATSLYLGGGSPALIADDLLPLRVQIDRSFRIAGNAGIELHPRDVVEGLPEKLRDAGFDMVSVGIQSFAPGLLGGIGREPVDGDSLFSLLGRGRFKAIDVDLIFALPGQTEEELRSDFLRAAELGATQISTYPFIDFSYANNERKPQGLRAQRRMLSALLETAAEAGFERSSVWTFGRKGAPRYSSVTRDSFIGFGPSATSLGRDAFKANTFSVEAYCASLEEGRLPTALRMAFTERTRRLYWLFWNCYNGRLSSAVYRELFGTDLEGDFRSWLRLGERAGLLLREGEDWSLTEEGSWRFHGVEQVYTHQYIDKTWALSLKTPWPEEIRLY